MIATPSPMEPMEPDHTPAGASPDPGRALTPGEALEALFLRNADRGANAENDALVAALLLRAREIQALLPDTTAQE